jgi:hypothetical protein
MPPRLFAGRCMRATRKKSQSFKDHNHLLAVGGGRADTPPKGHPYKVGLESPESSLFRSTANFLAKIGAECRYLEFASL